MPGAGPSGLGPDTCYQSFHVGRLHALTYCTASIQPRSRLQIASRLDEGCACETGNTGHPQLSSPLRTHTQQRKTAVSITVPAVGTRCGGLVDLQLALLEARKIGNKARHVCHAAESTIGCISSLRPEDSATLAFALPIDGPSNQGAAGRHDATGRLQMHALEAPVVRVCSCRSGGRLSADSKGLPTLLALCSASQREAVRRGYDGTPATNYDRPHAVS